MKSILTAAAMFAALPLAFHSQPLAAQGHDAASGQEANGPAAQEGDPVTAVRADDAAMNAAIAEAQATLPEWIALYSDPPAGYSNFAIKFPLEGVEHIWVAVGKIDGDTFIGRLANAPHAPGWSYGDVVRVPRSDISDWAYWDDAGKAHGYRTVEALFAMMDEAEVAAIKESFGWE